VWNTTPCTALSRSTDSRFSTESRAEDARPFCCCTIAIIIADVRAALLTSSEHYHLVAPDIPASATRLADPKTFFTRSTTTPNHEPFHRVAGALTVHAVHAGLRRAGGLSHGVGVSGPNRALIVQDAVAHNEGSCELAPEARVLADRVATRACCGPIFFRSPPRGHTCRGDPNVDRYDPDLWMDEFAFLSQPGQADIQSDLFFDYRTNVEAIPSGKRGCARRSHDSS